MYDVSEENIVQVWREDSPSLMIVFSGIFPVAGTGPFDFLREIGYARSNLIYLSDFYRSGYRHGVSSKLDSLDKVIDFCRQKLAGRQFEELVTVGASSGVLPAFLCAHACDARRSWGFGPRPMKDGLFPSVSESASPLDGWPKLMIRTNQYLARVFRRPARDWFAKRHVDWVHLETQLQQLAEYRQQSADPSEKRDFKVYYVPSNKTDTLIASRLGKIPGITGYPVNLPEDYAGDWVQQPGWDHSVIQVMRLGLGLNHYMNLC